MGIYQSRESKESLDKQRLLMCFVKSTKNLNENQVIFKIHEKGSDAHTYRVESRARLGAARITYIEPISTRQLDIYRYTRTEGQDYTRTVEITQQRDKLD